MHFFYGYVEGLGFCFVLIEFKSSVWDKAGWQLFHTGIQGSTALWANVIWALLQEKAGQMPAGQAAFSAEDS